LQEICKICGSPDFQDILKFDTLFFSDGNKSNEKLIKEECQKCGTIRTKLKMNLEEFYLKNYQPSRNIDTVALVDNEAINRSKFIYDWIKDLIPKKLFQETKTVLEIGCGQGFLLDKFDIKEKYGIEPSQEASNLASKIASIRNIGYEQINDNEKYDLVFSYCVIEHVENPNNFIQKNYQILNGGGIMCVALPIQDKFNYDLVFADHIHHFEDKNFKILLNNNGFEVINFELGRGSYFNIGMYICQKKEFAINRKFSFIKNKNINHVEQIFENINAIIEKYKNNQIFAFGYGEIAKTILPYTDLSSTISYYIDDYANHQKVFTSKKSKELFKEMNKVTLLLLVNPVHSEKIKQIYAEFKNINFIDIFENIKMEIA
jgi:2-polyprenyl-3-methyl-5-hydroxy-6-metoxy-1,4-benzoquinol methylase